MLTEFPICVLAGTVFGYLAGIGIGGGSLLVLWLTLITHTDPSITRMINLMFFLVSAGAATLIRYKKGTLRFKPLLPAILAGCTCAAMFSWIGTKIEPDFLKPLFGCFLIVAGLKELFYRPRKAK